MNIEDVKPTGARVLIEPYKSATKSVAGLVMENTGNASAAPVRGTVIAKGDKSKFKVGQEIYFRRYSTDVLKIVTPEGEKEILLVEDVDILCFIKPKSKK